MTDTDGIVVPPMILALAASRRAELVESLVHKIGLARQSNNATPITGMPDGIWIDQRDMRLAAIADLENQVAAAEALSGTALVEHFCPAEVEGLKVADAERNTVAPLSHAQIEAARAVDTWNKNRLIPPVEYPTLVRIVDAELAKAG